MLDVLRYLLEHADRLVPREEMMHRPWPEIAVRETVLTRAIGGARRALGEQGRKEGIVRTLTWRDWRR